MALFQHWIQRKLSRLLGAEVEFEKFKLSLLGGSIDIHGLRVAGDDPATPLLTAAQVRVEISIPRALKKEIVVKSLRVERPVVSLVLHEDGRSNLPRPMQGLEGPASPVAEPNAEPEQRIDEEQAPRAWALELQKIELREGEISYRSLRPQDGGYHAAAERIRLELEQKVGAIVFTGGIDFIGRRDRNDVDLGPLKLTGRLLRVTDLRDAANGGLEAQILVGDRLQVQVDSPSLARREVRGQIQGLMDLGALAALVPPGIGALDPLRRLNLRGQMEISLQGSYGPAEGVRVASGNFRLAGLALQPGKA